MPTDSQVPGEQPDFTEFLADYFVECDEHLAIARSSLLTLEETLQQSKVDPSVLNELFRSFHSVKGLSAMVGFHEAEQLAHHLETYLGIVRRGQLKITLEGIEALIQGVTTLEGVIAARRDATQIPNVSSLLQRLVKLVPVVSNDPATGGARPAALALGEKDLMIAEKTANGARAWQVVFSPSAELISRGIDVNSVRQRMQAMGEIVHSAPLIISGGQVEFLFILISLESEERFATFARDGLSCQLYSPKSASVDVPSQDADSQRTHEDRHSTHLTPANIVRVDMERLDELMRLVGELVLSRARLEDGLRRLDGCLAAVELRSLHETSSVIERQLRDLREGVMRTRMIPVRDVFARMRFVVRDAVRESTKQVSLQIQGEDTQIDKYVVERIMDPLLHLVRNAVSHGLESPEERIAMGKPAEGRLDLRAKATGETVIIEVEDDGRGIDAEAVISRARKLGLESHYSGFDTATVLDVLCIPGFSTRELSDRVSGRGIGMDVVRNAIEELGGFFTLHTRRGQGTRFEIQLPLTLAITDALIVQVGTERYAIPQAAVREILRIDVGSTVVMEHNQLLRHRAGVLPLIRVSQVFGASREPSEEGYALVIGEGIQGIALVVDRVLGLREIVVRPLTDRLVQVKGVAGATELGDGRVVLILDTANLSRRARIRVDTPMEASRIDATLLSNVRETAHVI